MFLDSPLSFCKVNLNSHEWNILKDLWNLTGIQSVKFTQEYDGWHIIESIEGVTLFSMRRDCVSLNRYTDLDKYGLLGLSLLDVTNTKCFITEGVSDFISTKLLHPNDNVLGVTNLGGSPNARKILVSLFTNITIVSDTDSTGITNAFRWKSLFDSFNIVSNIYKPDAPFKDISEEFIFNLKLDSDSVQF